MQAGPYKIRIARHNDAPAIKSLIRLSAHGLRRDDYTAEQVETALISVFGVDTQLIQDGTYFVVEADNFLVGCGGWSYRATLCGNDDKEDRDNRRLDPETEPARIRAFFVHPDYARRGIGQCLLDHCENEARTAGFKCFELSATLPGRRLYAANDYVERETTEHNMENGETLTIIRMTKTFE